MCKLKHKYHNSKGEKNELSNIFNKKKSVSKSNKKNIYSL